MWIPLFILIFSFTAYSSEPQVWEMNSRNDLLSGDTNGVSITDTGALLLAPRFTQVFTTEQPYIWSTAVDNSGNIYLGTGHDGRIYRTTRDGKGSLFYDSAELDVTALAVGPGGDLYAGTSPDGKVYRIRQGGQAEVYFDPPDKYIWSLAFLKDSLAIGTGDTGKIYLVKSSNARAENSLLIDIDEAHVISLLADRQGNLIAGTDPGGLVLRISPEGRAFAIYDSALREIHSLAQSDDGTLYALALSDTPYSSRTSLPVSPPQQSSSHTSSSSSTVTITAIDDLGGGAGPPQQPSRSRTDVTTARSAVYRILPSGETDIIWSSPTVVGFSIALYGRDLLIGTGDKGRVISVSPDDRDTLLVQSTEDQISSLLSWQGELYAASSNSGKLFRLGRELTPEGRYESPVRDAKFVATWGRIWWRSAGNVEIQTRTGNTERPDATWSDWTGKHSSPTGSQVTSPRSRFIQWRALLRNGNQLPRLEFVNLAYMPQNVAPEVLSVSVLPAGVGLQQVIAPPQDANIESSGLDPSLFGMVASMQPRRVYQKGAISFQWQAEDRNQDKLEYAIYYRALGESNFHLLKENLRDSFYTVDGATLSDGRYVIKVVASDSPSNPADRARTGERVSEPFDVDNTPPVVRIVSGPTVSNRVARITLHAEDQNGMVKRADLSVNSNTWRAIYPEDGIADSSRETFVVEIPLSGAGEQTVSLRVIDGSGNIGSTRSVVSQ
jgi:hypothetical protein